ncbi:STAS domain-containing protein [Muricauda sp. SCSIO 64092]|uniref:STAS domain-containing protein n=1 Tax=Allomuricauda sp. SCSIO 64092 TaxID=2908842 RepID=UPI001FF1A3B7|nr:STAS domain-containing protein [Muricauda sp. SCSIO 64092]UOY08114.1 STAS domain-containing protein [Muricauda sp. SCSIO 64092]
MALEIKENRGFFEVIGRVTSQNVNVLRAYFDSVLEQNDSIVISIEKVVEMDSSAAHLFEALYKEAPSNKKVVSIIGRQNKEISKIMEATNTDYILSTDRV